MSEPTDERSPSAEYVRPTIFDGVPDPEAVVSKSAGIGWTVEFSQAGQVAGKRWAFSKRGGERKARHWLSEYERWKHRVLTESVVVRAHNDGYPATD